MDASELYKSHPKKERTVTDIARYISNRAQQQPNYCFLLGAGASVSSGVRSAGVLVEEWRKDIFCELNSCQTNYNSDTAKQWLVDCQGTWYDPNKEYASLFERKFDLPAQRRMFVEQEVEKASPSIGYAYLTSLVRDRFLNTLFTTNFDDLINEAFFRFTDIRPISCAHDSSVRGITVTSQRPKIIKLHGDYLFDDIKCTAEQTSKLTENMDDKLKQFLKEYGLIVSGYSGCDDSVMDVLKLLVNDESYLKNGIYWCLRRTDNVPPQILNLLESEKVFFVYTDDFDSLFAELHNACCKGDTPFAEVNLISRVSKITDNWLNNTDIENVKSASIKKHLTELKNDRKSSILARSLADIFQDDPDRKNILNKLTDEEAAELIEIGKLLSKRKYKEAKERIELRLSETQNTFYKEQLLAGSYKANLKLNQYELAIQNCHELIKLGPEYPHNFIKESDATNNIDRKLELIEKAISMDEYSWIGHFEKASALIEAIEYGEMDDSTEITTAVTDSLKVSILRRPGINNPSWAVLFDFLIEHRPNINGNPLAPLEIIHTLQDQDPYGPKVCQLIYEYCKYNSDSKFDGTDIFAYLDKAIANHIPKNSPVFLGVVVDASIEFENHQFARTYSKRLLPKDEMSESTPYTQAKYRLFMEIDKDINKAISYLTKAIEKNEEPPLVSSLIYLLTLTNNASDARNIATKHFHILSTKEAIKLESDVLACEGQYIESNDELEKLSDDPRFDLKYGSSISFNLLKAKLYQQAYDYCHQILVKHKFTDQLSALRINYEFSRTKLNKKVHKPKIIELEAISTSKDVKAMAELLMGNDEACLEIMVAQTKKRYSKIYQFSNWPVAESIIARFHRNIDFRTEIFAVSV